MNFISGGYYFSQGQNPPEWTNTALLPKVIWSVSEAISEVFPAAWAFTTGTDPAKREKKFFMDLLGLNANEFLEMEKFFDDLYLKKLCGFPNVIYDLPTARLIYQHYLFRLQNLKLLGLGLPNTYFDEFVQETASPSQYLKSSLRHKVLKKEPPSLDGHILGFDVLGYDGGFWPFISQGFETAFSQELGIHLNSYGLIDSFDDAAKALAYVKAHDPEEGVWFFWQVMEYTLITP
jgi:hypothetical protein